MKETNDQPKCYSCIYAIRRGNFRLCRKNEMGYKHIGEEVKCGEYERITDEN